MNQTQQSEFSYDIYPGSDAELDAALARNVESGAAEPGAIATSGLTAVVERTLEQQKPEINLSSDAQSWAERELITMHTGFHSWQKYRGELGGQVPSGLAELNHPNLAEKLNRLYDAKKVLDRSGETTPSGEAIGDTMRLVAIPWEAFRKNLDNLPSMLARMRDQQSVNETDYLNEHLLEAVQSGRYMYKAWDSPALILSAKEYLEKKIKEDGEWGLALMQTSDEAGVKSLMGKSPDELTDRDVRSPVVAGVEIGSMGVFEWLALTLQEDPKKLSSKDYSWMLANRIDVDGGAQVPYGAWYDDQVESNLAWSDNQSEDVRPRLAVI